LHISTISDAIAIGADTTEIKHRASKWRARHRASLCAGPT
jgi:hypothetical protein